MEIEQWHADLAAQHDAATALLVCVALAGVVVIAGLIIALVLEGERRR